MYDSLEGLDYKPGELSKYVSRVLENVEKSKENKDLRYVSLSEIKVGDVCVKPYSSHLVLDPEYYQWSITRRKGDREEALIIPSEVLERMRNESSKIITSPQSPIAN